MTIDGTTVAAVVTVVGVMIAAVTLWIQWRHRAPRANDPAVVRPAREIVVRKGRPKIVAKGRAPFRQSVADAADTIALALSGKIDEVRLLESDPGENRLLRLIATHEDGNPGRIRIWTDEVPTAPEFWGGLDAYAEKLADLERKYFNNKFFAKVVALAVTLEPIAFTTAGQKKDFDALIRAVALSFHRAAATALAADGLKHVATFYEPNFRLKLAADGIDRYIWLRVFASVCKDMAIQHDFRAPSLVEEIDTAVRHYYDHLRSGLGTNENELLLQAEKLAIILRAGHKAIALSTMRDGGE